LRIALITRRYPPLIGGAEKVLSYLAPALAERGHEVTVWTSRPPGLKTPEVEEVPTKTGSCVVRRLDTNRIRFLGTWVYMRNLRKALEAEPPDLAYVSMLKHDAYVTVGVGAERGFPVVLRPEGAGATGDLAWQGRANFGRRIAERVRRADAFVAISKAVEEELRRAGIERERIHRLPNGVPVPEPPWQRRPDWKAEPRAVSIGRLAPEKGLDLLIQAWVHVRERVPNARLTIHGEGPEQAVLEAGVGKLGLGDRIAFPGPTSDPIEALRHADLFVLPSREEGMSIALLEAMSLGVPIVASAIPGNRRLLGDYKEGRLAPPEDPEALAAVIVEQWSEFDRAVHMGRAARKAVAHRYSVEAVARDHVALFGRLIEERRGSAAPSSSPDAGSTST